MCNCDTDNDAPSAFRSTQRRARKEHTCVECDGVIPPGMVYEYASGVWDGRGDSFKTCSRCVVLREAHVKAEEMVQRDENVRYGSYGRFYIEPCNVTFGGVIAAIGECAREGDSYVKHFRDARRTLLMRGT